jgi:phosphatidylinositol glycan class O
MPHDLRLCIGRCGGWQLVVIVVDALRLDFVTGTEAPPHPLAFIRELASRTDGTAALFPFLADPPTVTAQRLKGLTTGSLPTFLDARDNFASPAIDEDNWVAQMRAANRGPMLFAGDDTWLSLFPNEFSSAYPFPSFDVRDFDTVDRGAAGVMRREVWSSGAAAWSLVVCHLLGVDHVGHTHGAFNPHMTAKLREVDGIVQEAVSNLDTDTLLVVISDHGALVSGWAMRLHALVCTGTVGFVNAGWLRWESYGRHD